MIDAYIIDAIQQRDRAAREEASRPRIELPLPGWEDRGEEDDSVVIPRHDSGEALTSDLVAGS